MTFEEARERALRAVRAQEEGMSEGQDWMPVLLVEREAEGEDGRMAVEIPAGLVGDAAFLRDAVERLRGIGATFFAFVNGATLRRADDPDATRFEAVVVLCADGKGRVEAWQGRVYRPERRGPHLGPWEQIRAFAGGAYEAMGGKPPGQG